MVTSRAYYTASGHHREDNHMSDTNSSGTSHNLLVGYCLWIFGFMGAHRFYYGRQLTGIIWFFTLGLFFIGWIVDLFLIPGMELEADHRYVAGELNYSVAWLLLTFLGLFGVHRMYMGKWITGIIYLLTGGIFMIGILYDYLTLNGQIDATNRGIQSW
jgi:TM2 domain-containing membrane protein YozV